MANPLEMLLRLALRKEGVDSGLRETRQGVSDLGGAAEGASGTTTRLGGGLGNVTKAAAGLAAGLFGGVGLVYGLKQASGAATDFGAKMAEVSTLLDDTGSLDELTAKTRELAREFGNAPTEQAQALYNIISAGASDSADAMRLLTEANKLALGGVTEVPTRMPAIENALEDVEPAEATFAPAVAPCEGLTALDDVHVSAAYRTHLARVLSRRALTIAARRAQEETA